MKTDAPGTPRPIKNGFRFCLLFFPGLIVSAGCRARPALEEAASGNTADVLRAAGEKAVAISAASALSEPLWTFLIAAGIGLLGVGGVGVLLKARRFALALRLIRGALFLVRKRLRR